MVQSSPNCLLPLLNRRSPNLTTQKQILSRNPTLLNRFPHLRLVVVKFSTFEESITHFQGVGDAFRRRAERCVGSRGGSGGGGRGGDVSDLVGSEADGVVGGSVAEGDGGAFGEGGHVEMGGGG